MGRFSESVADDSSDTGIDMSPLIDCVFILLIFFIVTTVFVEETGVEVNKPLAASASNLEKTSLLIAITDTGQVFAGGSEIGVAGVRPLVKRALLKDSTTPVILQTDMDSKAGAFMRVLDEVNLAGAKKVSMSTLKGGS